MAALLAEVLRERVAVPDRLEPRILLEPRLRDEPSAVAGLAAILEDRAAYAGLRVATVLTGSNVTAAQMRAWLAP